MYQLQQNHRLRTEAAQANEEPECILPIPNLHPRFCCCLNTNLLSSRGGFLTVAMCNHSETINWLSHYDETKKNAHYLQIVRAKEKVTVSPAKDQVIRAFSGNTNMF